MRKLKEMETFELRGEYIQLNQLLKALGWVENGGAANAAIDEGYVMVNGEIEVRKRNKIYRGMVVDFQENKVKIA